MKNVLITGGTGTIGRRLSKFLIERGYSVSHLSRSASHNKEKGIKVYKWDIDKGYIDEEAIQRCDYIVHLAGADIAEKRWTPSRKREILESRTETLKLLYEKLKELDHSLKALVSISAIGYYGDTGDALVDEESPRGKGFMADVCVAWEKEAFRLKELGYRVAVMRAGVVLSNRGGALQEFMKPFHFGLGIYMGNGKQYVSWIHIDDLCHIFIKAIEDEKMEGVYNAVAPNPVRNKEFIRAIAKVTKKFHIKLSAPAFALKLALGDMAEEAVLAGQKVASKKIEEAGFEFKFHRVEGALRDLLDQ